MELTSEKNKILSESQKKILDFLEKYYTDILLVERLSKKTAYTYKLSVEIFLNWCLNHHIKLKSVTVQDLMTYLAFRQTEKKTTITIAKDISALRSFGFFMVRKNMWEENYALLLERPKAVHNLPKVLSENQVETLLNSSDNSNPCGIRDDALFELIYSCGLRVSEACSLLVDNLHLEEQIILVRGKGNKERYTILPKASLEMLREYYKKERPNH